MSSKVYNTRKLATLVVAFIGILYMVGAFFVFTRQDYDRATNDMRTTMQYVKSQYLEFKKLDTASEAKSLVRMMDKMNQITMDMQLHHAGIEPEMLKHYAEEFRLTGIVVLSEQGDVLSQYSRESVTFSDFKKEILRRPVLDVANTPKKLYTRRIVQDDGSYLDVGAHKRVDAPGIIVCYYHTPKNYIENYNLSLQSLLQGYNPSKDGTVVISNGYKILASNNIALNDMRVDQNKMIEELRTNGKRGELVPLTSPDGRRYFGSLDRGRDFFAYIAFPESKVYATRWAKLADAFVFYLVLAGIFFYFLRHSEKEHLEQQHELDEKYKGELIKAAADAERANKAKTIFLQRMSHDIRTPINGIRGMLEIACQNLNNIPKLKECHQKIEESSRYLLDLVNEVLDLGKLNSGEITLESVPFDIRKLCDEVLAMLSNQAQAKNIEITTTREESVPQFLIGSPVHLKRILSNVLSNAIKYNKLGGKVFLKIKELDRKADCVLLEFSCEDTGVGISKEFLPHVFEAFTQDIDAARSEYEGSGLGMPIVKTLVGKMGGNIEVTSEQGEGSIFSVRLPFAIDMEKEAQPPIEQVFNKEIVRGLHVLVAEDNALNMEIVQYFLDNAGITFTAVRNGQEALKVFAASKQGEYDAILMDIMMPVMDGLEATRQIRALEREDAADVPIIAMTANAFVEDKLRSLEAGMNEHITKPLECDVLLRALATCVQKVK